MTVNTNLNGDKLEVAIEGRLDTTTAPELEEVLSKFNDSVASVDFDFAKLEYISSAGLRVLLAEQKLMNKKGGMVIHNVCDAVMEVFEITGFVDILTIQ